MMQHCYTQTFMEFIRMTNANMSMLVTVKKLASRFDRSDARPCQFMIVH